MVSKKTFSLIIALITAGFYLHATVEKKETPGHKTYKKGDLVCNYDEVHMPANKGGGIMKQYTCKKNNTPILNPSEATNSYNSLECEWCKENTKTDGACSACPTK